MKKEIKAVAPVSLLVRCLAVGMLGLLVLLQPDFVRRFLNIVLVGVLLLNGIPALAVFLFRGEKRKKDDLGSAIISIACAAVILVFPHLVTGSISIAVGLWALLVALVQLSFAYQLYATQCRGIWYYAVLGVISLFTAFPLLTGIPFDGKMLNLVAGLYLLLYALWLLADLIGTLLHYNVESSALLSRLRIKPPVVLTALLPSLVVNEINKVHKQNPGVDVISEPSAPSGREYPGKLEVLFHLGKNVAYGFGHVDVCFEEHVYSYGCYDDSSNRLMGILSDGTFMVAPREPYLNYCRAWEKKSLVGFTLGLSEQTTQDVRNALDNLLKDCESWYPSDQNKVGENTPRHAADTIVPHPRYYKVKEGPFKMYNTFRTNCAAMAELIASRSGLNLLPPEGVVTPGAYFAFLGTELREKNSNVIRRTVYAALSPAKSEKLPT